MTLPPTSAPLSANASVAPKYFKFLGRLFPKRYRYTRLSRRLHPQRHLSQGQEQAMKQPAVAATSFPPPLVVFRQD